MSTCEVCPPDANCPGPKFESVPDDVRGHFDGTDGAHPAWWRGNHAGFESAARDLFETIAEPMRVMRQAGVNPLPYHLLRIRVATLAINEGCVREELKARDELIIALGKELAEAKRALEIFAARERREGRT